MGLLEEGVALLGLRSDAELVARLGAYLREIELWNRRVDLVGASGGDLVVRHVLDSLAGAETLRGLPRSSVADVGSGAGFPGIPLAMALPDARFTLIERSSTRAAFLRNAVALCGLSERVEVREVDLAREVGRYDVVTFRALGGLGKVIEPLSRITRPGGAMVAYKGRSETIAEEIESLPARRWRIEIVPLSVPFLAEERHLVVVKEALSA